MERLDTLHRRLRRLWRSLAEALIHWDLGRLRAASRRLALAYLSHAALEELLLHDAVEGLARSAYRCLAASLLER